MRVMSFNIRFDNPNDGPNAWPHRKDFVASMFRFHQADIVGTQEALHNQLLDLKTMLPEYNWVGVGRDDGKEAGEFCAIYFKTDRFTLIEGDTFWLSETPEEPGSMSWDTAITRIVTWARLHDKTNDRRFIIFNTHYDHRGVQAREQSSVLLMNRVNELADGDPVIVMGDLNVTEEQMAYRILAEPELHPGEMVLFDGFYHSRYGHHGPDTTWNGFNQIVPNRRIDYIFVNQGFSVIQHGILADVRDGRFPSDHLPVLAEIRFSD
ncbi:MAG: endonuclease/exonuclease/phosphatase family protein [Balneolaceae bacterium]|nr:MAG: endonuclease/exonuclease/phosphatase family protein [Balneolaceae bacterium]